MDKQLDRWKSWGTSEKNRRYPERLETHIHQGLSSVGLSFLRHQLSTVEAGIKNGQPLHLSQSIPQRTPRVLAYYDGRIMHYPNSLQRNWG